MLGGALLRASEDALSSLQVQSCGVPGRHLGNESHATSFTRLMPTKLASEPD
jgi:hypothetical protein